MGFPSGSLGTRNWDSRPRMSRHRQETFAADTNRKSPHYPAEPGRVAPSKSAFKRP